MKTVVKLTDDLMRQVKARAEREHKDVNAAAAELIEMGIARSTPRRPHLAKPVKLKGGPMTFDDLDRAINWGRA